MPDDLYSYKAYFASKKQVWTNQPPASVLIYPRDTGWNDHSFHVRASMRVKAIDHRAPLALDLYVLGLEDPDTGVVAKSLLTWINSLNSGPRPGLLEADGDQLAFVSLLGDDIFYRRLAEWAHDPTERIAVLDGINDLNLMRMYSILPQARLDRILESDAFTLGVMRSSSAYRAYRKGTRFITREPLLPLVDDARIPYRVEALLRGFDAPHRLTVAYASSASIASDRAHVLIGKNGVGKSQLLNQVLGSLAVQADPSESSIFLDHENEEFRSDDVTGLPIPNSVLLFSGDQLDTYPRGTRTDTALDYTYFNLASMSASSADGRPSNTIVGSIRDLLRDGSVLQGRSRLAILKKVLDPVLPIDQLYLPIKKESTRIYKTVLDKNSRQWLSLSLSPTGEQQKLYVAADIDDTRDVALLDEDQGEYPPSSGQRAFLRFASQALSVVSQGSLFLIDEPETHLHPNFVSEFMNLLHQLLEETNSVALIATHSPFVVREVPGNCVHVVKTLGKTPQVTGVHLKTLGASVSSISDAVFGDATARKFHALLAAKIAHEAIGKTTRQKVEWVLDHYGSELNMEMLSTIRFMLERPQEGGGD